MKLSEAKSKEEVEDALEAGDTELLEDIQEKLDESKRDWERNFYDYVEGTPIVLRDWMGSDAFVEAVIEQSADVEVDLSQIPVDRVELELGSIRPPGGFAIDEHPERNGFSFQVPTEDAIYFPAHLLPRNHLLIPEGIAEDFWDSVGHGVTWNDTSHVDDNVGVSESSENAFIVASRDDFAEFCRDVLSGYVSLLIDQDPQKAVSMFLNDLPISLAEQVKASLSTDDLLDFAHRYLVDQDRDDVLADMEEVTLLLTESQEPHDIVAEVTRDDLAALGITKGTLYEEAPWKLIDLRPSDLRIEGTRMRHCVGDRSMGYLKAVADGEVNIWSLRSRANKPRFTLEISPDGAGRTINQLKGKANRTPGHASSNAAAADIRFPDEVVFWTWLLDKLGVDPWEVDDMDALRATEERGRMTANNRTHRRASFNRPYKAL